MQRNLPDFANPPLIEVALSLQFEALEDLRTPQLGLLWSEFRERFPNTEERAPLESVIERFGVSRSSSPSVRMQLVETPPVPRVWFINQSGTELIQIQQDRFIHNWRKTGAGDEYPRYEHLRDTFVAELKVFQATVERDQCGKLIPNQCEITYVNHLLAGEGWTTHEQLGVVISAVQSNVAIDGAIAHEDTRLIFRFVIHDDAGKPIGRLHANVEPAFRVGDKLPMFIFTLTARLQPAGNDIGDVLSCLDRGRECIVRGFAALTTPQMHSYWGRKDA